MTDSGAFIQRPRSTTARSEQRGQELSHSGSDVAVVIPTYKRPEQLARLLSSLAAQTVIPAEIVVVSAGEDVSSVVGQFQGRLNIAYVHSDRGGQILQRNLGISRVSEARQFIVSLDDDIVVEADAVEMLLGAWNRAGPRCAGIAFNMVNEPSFKRNRIAELLGLQPAAPGLVNFAGVNSSLAGLASDIQTQWLPGGATCWRSSVLRAHPHRPIEARWAAGEDVVYSFPLSRNYEMMACASARVFHYHLKGRETAGESFRLGRTFALWRGYFVRLDDRLSPFGFYYVSLLRGAVGMAVGAVRSRWKFAFSLGMVVGTVLSFIRRGKIVAQD